MRALVTDMAALLAHRGPDDHGAWVDSEVGIALGHRRLAILELSPAGHQPMFSRDGRYTIVFNGEIYNFRELSAQLAERGHQFNGHSDTEVMLAAFSEWGVEHSLKKFIGMFAFALWDRKDRRLYLARDRMGEKPLYYGWQDGSFLFGSELKAIRAHPNWRGGIDPAAVLLFTQHGYIPGPFSIYRGIHKLPPGTFLSLDAAQVASRESAEPRAYWSLKEAAETATARPFTGTPEEAVERLDSLLRDAVRLQMVADVPLGAFLSGGIDSSTIVAVMQSLVHRPVQTFTIGFSEAAYNEADHAKAVAQHLGTDHTELYATPQDAMAVIPRLPSIYDEPFSDYSQIPTVLVAALARRRVTVTLSGDAGDELFGGYPRYRIAQKTWRRMRSLPHLARRGLGSLLRQVPVATWDAVFNPLLRACHRPELTNRVGGRMQRLGRLLNLNSPDQIYLGLITHWPREVLAVAHSEPISLGTIRATPERLGFEERMMYLDSVAYLPDDILVKVDRASMAASLESRVPLLDHRIVEFAWSVPLNLKMRNGVSKWLLRKTLDKYVPRHFVDRPKMGFGVPVGQWIRGPLRDWAESLLEPTSLQADGFFDVKTIRDVWNQHDAGKRNFEALLWDILMFQAWRTAHSESAHN